ncbi:MAG TPA: TAXI family TRAP transporter solute-binding subunit [Mycobacterium sp.]|nr:TAXI family TRAP transporter solute-binding subunit [Mycobacterium sp.]
MGRRAFLAAAMAAFVAGCIRSDPGGRMRLAAGDPGGMYLAFAEILAKRVQARYPGVTVEVVATEGTVENLARLRAGDVDMGLALADIAERDRAADPSATAPQAVARVYENYLQVIVRSADVAQQLSDLAARRVSFGAARSGGAATSEVLFEAAGLRSRMDVQTYRLKDALSRLADGGIDALVWSGGVPTPAIADLNGALPLRMLDIGALAEPMSRLAGFPYVVRQVPSGGYVPPGIHSIGVPDLLLCRQHMATDLVGAVVDVLATDASQLVPPYVRGLQYLAPPTMIQTGLIPLHPGAVDAYRELHG